MQNSSATLVGLPTELRINIYDHIFQQCFDIKPLDGFKLQRHYPPRPNGLQGSYIRVNEFRSQRACFSIPWLNLMLSCTTIAEEMKQYMESSSYRDIERNRTLEMDLRPATQGEAGSWVTVAWRRIPCPPQQMRRLIVHSNGAAQTVIPALNLFLHCGISMDRKRPLQEHLVLDELVINVLSTRALAVPDQTPGVEPVDEQIRSMSEFEHVQNILSNYHYVGKLSGYLRRVCIFGREENVDFEVVHPFKPGFPYFPWGVSEAS